MRQPTVFGALVACGECGASVDVLTKTHMRIQHNMTKARYLELHPEHDQPQFWAAITKRTYGLDALVRPREPYARRGGVAKAVKMGKWS